jgi:hypothetical protein
MELYRKGKPDKRWTLILPFLKSWSSDHFGTHLGGPDGAEISGINGVDMTIDVVKESVYCFSNSENNSSVLYPSYQRPFHCA